MNPVLRLATEKDYPEISALAHRIWREHYVPIVGAEQVEFMLASIYNLESLKKQAQNGQVFWMAEMDGNPFGYLAVENTGPGHYFLHKFYLENPKRRCGIGQYLFEQLLMRCEGLQEMRLNVNRENYKSINFYFKMGFVIEYCLVTPFGGGYVMDDFRMVLQNRKP
jgi:GNAT superfamily N-acetyltransferase